MVAGDVHRATLVRGQRLEPFLERQDKVIQNCSELCDRLNSLVASDAKGRAKVTSLSQPPEQRTGLGLILSEVTISFILPTSNAHRTKQLQAGDVIVEVDGIKANKDNVAELLRGEDVPESSVDLLIRRKEAMIGGWQLLQGGVVEEALTLWTHIQDSHDAYHDAIAQNTARLQRDKTIIVAQLRESLAEMKALSVEAFSKVQEQEDTRIELVSRIDELEQQIETLSQQQREAVAASQADRRDKAHLTEQVLTLNGQLWSLNQQCVSLHRQTEQDSKIIAAANEELGKSKAWFRTRKDELTNELQDTASKLSEFAARCAAATLRIKELEVALQEAESANARNSAKIGECAVKIVEQERALHKASSDAVDISTEYKQLQQLLDQEQAAHTAAVEKLQQLLDQEQAAHTAAVEKTESLRREFLSADSTISALRAERAALHAQISELQASHHSSTQALQERVKQLQQLLDQEQAAHTAALVKTKSLRRDFLTADATISALGAQLSELQASHDSCTQSLQERNRECKILESVLAESCVNNFRDEEQAEAEMAPLRGHSPLVDAAISRFLLLSQLTSRLGACQQEMAQSLAASEEDRQGLLRKLDLIMNEYDRLRDEYVAREETATLSHKALQEKTTVKIINLENEAIELRAILAQVEQALGCPWPAFARMRLSQNPKASVLHLLARTDAANLDRMSSPQRTLSPVATANCSLCVPPPGFTLSEGAERAASATPQSISSWLLGKMATAYDPETGGLPYLEPYQTKIQVDTGAQGRPVPSACPTSLA